MVTAGNIKNGLPFLGIVQVERRPILTVRVFFSRRGGENDLVRNPLQQNAAYLQFQLDPRFASGAAAGNMPYRCVQVRDALPDRTVEGLRQGPGEDFIIAGQFAAVIRTNQVRGTAPGNLDDITLFRGGQLWGSNRDKTAQNGNIGIRQVIFDHNRDSGIYTGKRHELVESPLFKRHVTDRGISIRNRHVHCRAPEFSVQLPCDAQKRLFFLLCRSQGAGQYFAPKYRTVVFCGVGQVKRLGDGNIFGLNCKLFCTGSAGAELHGKGSGCIQLAGMNAGCAGQKTARNVQDCFTFTGQRKRRFCSKGAFLARSADDAVKLLVPLLNAAAGQVGDKLYRLNHANSSI